MTYEELLNEAYSNNIYVIEKAGFESKSDGLISGDVIGINRKIESNKKRTCILAEELGHYHTTAGDIINQSSAANRKQEHRAKIWAYNSLIGIKGIISAHKHGCLSMAETAEYLDVTEEFLQEAIVYYKAKYGIYVKADNCVIYFEPSVGVFEMI